MEIQNFSLEGITQEIRGLQKKVGATLFEIGRRLKYVKEHDLSHGQFGTWLESVDIKPRAAQRMIQAYDQFSHTSAATELSAGQITEMLTLPAKVDREDFVTREHVVPSTGEIKKVSAMTTKEIREIVAAMKGKQGGIKIESAQDRKQGKLSETAERELLQHIAKLESENARLKEANRKKDNKISSLETELLFQKAMNAVGGSQDNGLRVFATMLGISEDAGVQEIREAFRKNRKKVHHDQGDLDWVSARYNLGSSLFKKLYQIS